MDRKIRPINEVDEPSPIAEDAQCRICFDVESEGKDLIIPCLCTGSIKYVHEECLKTWLTTSGQDIKKSKCDICKHQFKMEINYSTACVCNIHKEDRLKFCVVQIATLMISGILTIVLFYFFNGIHNKTLSIDEIVYFCIVITTCATIISSLIYTLIKLLIPSCLKVVIHSWAIKSISKAKVFEETLVVTNQEELMGCKLGDGMSFGEKNENCGIEIKSASIPPINVGSLSRGSSSMLSQNYRNSRPNTERFPYATEDKIFVRQNTIR